MRDLESGVKTLDDFADGKVPGEEPPDLVKELDDAVLAWGSSEYGSPEYIEAFQKVFDLHAEQLFLIGSVGVTPTLASTRTGSPTTRRSTSRKRPGRATSSPRPTSCSSGSKSPPGRPATACPAAKAQC